MSNLSVCQSCQLFSCEAFILPLASYFRAVHLTLHPSICLVSLFRTNHLTIHPSITLASHFRADHLTLHLHISLAIYFCYFHPFIGMASNISLSIHLRFICVLIVRHWMIVETDENQNSLLIIHYHYLLHCISELRAYWA